uniref:Centromere-associated protein E n=1 Tax=Geotrypetes seraphini TaxID=260995 RepID=A0A6P8S4J8_GEOSA|nr:centromere-associated protein E [Geotrypetes seraphini]
MSEEDTVKVCVRLRPLIHREKSKDQGDSVTFFWKADQCSVSQTDGTKSFNFDRVFHSGEATETVYQEIAVPIIHSVIQGYNGTIFAYGQTASGKTYTMMGTNTSYGIIPHAIGDIFKIITENMNREFLLRISYMEIYNETVTDLLCDDRKKKPLEIRENINRSVYVADLSEEVVVHPEDVVQWIKKGEKNRHYGETKMNEHSSRSHTIFRMIIESREKTDSGNAENIEGCFMVSHLNLVDLAGSERASQTGAEGVRLKEGCNINRSLFTLGQVIKRLSDDQTGGFINYRDSKLTRILQTSLGGNAKTVIICTINPVCFDETLSTLQFASTAKYVKNKPQVNETSDEEPLLKRYRKEVLDLKKRLEELEASSETQQKKDMAKEEHAQLLSEIELLKMEKEDRMRNLTRLLVGPSSHISEQDLRTKRKRRVTWAPGKLHGSLSSETVSNFTIAPNITSTFSKKAKITDLPLLTEMDDSFGTEYLDFDDTFHSTNDEFSSEPEWNPTARIFQRAKSDVLTTRVDYFTLEGQMQESVPYQEAASKYIDLKKKVEELECKLQLLAREKANEVERRKALEEKIVALQRPLQASEQKSEMKSFETEVEDLEKQSHVSNETENQKEIEFFQENVEVSEQLQVNQAEDAKGETVVMEKETADLVHDQVNVKDCDLENISMPEIQVQSINTKTLLEQNMELEVLQSLSKEENNDGKMYAEQIFLESIQLLELEKKNTIDALIEVRTDFNNLVLEHEHLRKECAMMETQLKEKMDINEFEMLEKEAQKEHEAQLMHEIVSLKKLIKNTEQFNQELETELGAKLKLLQEREKELTAATNQIEQLQKKARNMDIASSMGNTENLCEELYQMKQSFCDAEAVTRDAHKDIAFLRSENRVLKENMDQLSTDYKQMEKDAQKYRSQLEAEKARFKQMQSDMQKELQYAFNENTKLTVLMDGKVPKDLLCQVELEKTIIDLTKQLEKAREENEVEKLKNQMSSLMEEIKNRTAIQEQLLSENGKFDQVQKKLSIEVEQFQEQLMVGKSLLKTAEREKLEVAQNLDELQEKLSIVMQEKDALHQMYEKLQAEKDQLKEDDMHITEQLSSLMDELKDGTAKQKQLLNENGKLDQVQKKLSIEVEQFQEQLMTSKSLLETAEREKLELAQNVDELQEKLSIVMQEKDVLHEKLQAERNQLEDNLQTTEQESSFMGELKDGTTEQEQLINEVEQLQEQLMTSKSSLETAEREKLEIVQKLDELQEKVTTVTQGKDELHQMHEKLQAERDQLKEDIKESIEESIEVQHDLRIAQQDLKEHKQLVNELRMQIAENAKHMEEKSREVESTTSVQEKLSSLMQELQQKNANEVLLLKEKEQIQQAEAKVISELGHLQERLTASESMLERTEGEKLQVLQQLHKLQEELSSLTRERDELQQTWEAAESQLKGQIKQCIHTVEETSQLQSANEELKDDKLEERLVAAEKLKEENEEQKQELVKLQHQLIESQEELINLKKKLNMQQKNEPFLESEQATYTDSKFAEASQDLTSSYYDESMHEKEELNQTEKALLTEVEHLKYVLKICQSQPEAVYEENLNVQHEEKLKANMLSLHAIEREKSDLMQKVKELKEELSISSQEKDELLHIKEIIQVERDQLQKDIRENSEQSVKIQDELRTTQDNLNQQKQLVNELRIQISKLSESMEEKSREVQEATSLQEKLSSVKKELQQKTAVQDQLLCEKEVTHQAQQKLTRELTQLQETLTSCESIIKRTEDEKLEVTQQLEKLQEEFGTITQERNELQQSQNTLQTERDKFKESLKENVDKSVKAQEELRMTQENLKEEKELVAELRAQVEKYSLSIEEKSREFQAAISKQEKFVKAQEELRISQEALKEQKELVAELRTQMGEYSINIQEKTRELEAATSEQEKLSSLLQEFKKRIAAQEEHFLDEKNECDRSQKKLAIEAEQLQELLKSSRSSLDKVDGEKLEVMQKLHEVQETLSTVTQAKDELQQMMERLQAERNQLTEDIKKNNEQIVKQNEDFEHLKSQHSLLLLKREEENGNFQACVSENKVLKDTLSTLNDAATHLNAENASLLVKVQECETWKASLVQETMQLQELIERLRAEKERICLDLQEKDKMNVKQNEDFEHLKSQHSLLLLKREEENGNFQACVSENKVLKDTLSTLNDAATHLNAEKASLLVKVQGCETRKASLVQETMQLQELIERLRAEKERICLDLQEKDKMSSQLMNELKMSQTSVQSLQEKLEDMNENFAEKLIKESDLENHVASQDQQLELLCQKLQEEKMKNNELSNHIDLLEKEISVMQSNHYSQTEIEIAKFIGFQEERNQQLQELVERFFNIDSQHNSCINRIYDGLSKEVECQKELMAKVNESLSATLSKSFARLQNENLKLNTQFQTQLYKFKFIYETVALRESHYNIVKDYEKDLADVKKTQDELVLQIENKKNHSTLWSEATSQFRNYELKSLKEFLQKKEEFIKKMSEDMSAVEHTVTSIWDDLQREVNARENIIEFLKEYTKCNFDDTTLFEKIQQENKRITQVMQLQAKTLQSMIQRKTQLAIRNYFMEYEYELREKKAQTEKLHSILKQLASSTATTSFEEETYRLSNRLKTLEQEQKEMLLKVQMLENDLSKAKADVKHKEEKATALEKKLESKTTEHELKELKTKLVEKECHLGRIVTEMKDLQTQLDKGAKPYQEEIGNLKTQLVKLDMEKTKQYKLMEQEVTALKSCLEDKEENIRKLKEQLRRSQQDQDASMLPEREQPHPSNLPLTCGGGSGIVQNTAMLVLKSEKTSLEKQLAQQKKKHDRQLRHESLLKDELQKWKEKAMKYSQPLQTEVLHKRLPMSPKKTEISVINSECTSSHLKTLSSQETSILDSPKNKVSDLGTSLHISHPIQFFDNSCFATLPDAVPSENMPDRDPLKDWWTVPDKKDGVPECKPS